MAQKEAFSKRTHLGGTEADPTITAHARVGDSIHPLHRCQDLYKQTHTHTHTQSFVSGLFYVRPERVLTDDPYW